MKYWREHQLYLDCASAKQSTAVHRLGDALRMRRLLRRGRHAP